MRLPRPLLSWLLLALAACGMPRPPEDPEHLLGPDGLRRVEELVSRATFSRQLTSHFNGRLPLYNHLMDRPALTARLLHALHLDTAVVEPLEAGTWSLRDSSGLTGTLTELGAGPTRRWLLAEMTGPGVFGWQVRTTILFDVTVHPEEDGLHQELRAHVHLRGLMGWLARLVLPLAGRAFDARLDQALRGGRELTTRLHRDPRGTLDALIAREALRRPELAALRAVLGEKR